MLRLKLQQTSLLSKVKESDPTLVTGARDLRPVISLCRCRHCEGLGKQGPLLFQGVNAGYTADGRTTVTSFPHFTNFAALNKIHIAQHAPAANNANHNKCCHHTAETLSIILCQFACSQAHIARGLHAQQQRVL
jgi:hypothetical protein